MPSEKDCAYRAPGEHAERGEDALIGGWKTQQQNVGGYFLSERRSRWSSNTLADDLQPGVGFEQASQAVSKDRIAIGNDDANSVSDHGGMRPRPYSRSVPK